MSLFNCGAQAQFGKATVSDKAGYLGPAGMPIFDRGPRGDFKNKSFRGSKGGPVIWMMRETWMPKGRTSAERLHRLRQRVASGRVGRFEAMELAANSDVDGFAIFGRYPRGFLQHVVRLQLLGDVGRDQILHVCSGTMSETEKWTVDIREAARPQIRASGTALPFRSETFMAIMIDPPYSDEYARNLYGVENPRPSWLLREAARVVRPNGRIGLLHVAVPFAPPHCRLVNVYGVTTGLGYRIRAFTVFEKKSPRLFTGD